MRGPDELLAWRKEFPAVMGRTFLGQHTLAPLSRRARAGVDRFLDAWEQKGSAELVWFEDILPEMRRLEGLYARLIGADADEVALTPSVTTGLASIASCLRFDRRREVILSRREFPTDCHVWLSQEFRGAKVVWIDDMEASSYARAAGEQTAAICASRVSYLDGRLVDVRRIVNACRETGAMSIIDDFHGSATVPIDVHDLGNDALVAGPLKYLLGGPGIAFVYVRRELIPSMQPSITGWFSQANFFDFDNSALVWPETAQRFTLGTPSPAAIFAAAAGLEIILEVGVERSRERVQDLIDYGIALAEERSLTVRTPRERERRGGLLVIEVPDAKRALEKLLAAGVVIDERHGALRVSPGFYTSEDDIDTFFLELDRI